MKKFSQQLQKKATSTVTLQAAERRELRERVVSYMEYHPLPATTQAKAPLKQPSSVIAEPFTMVVFPFHSIFKYGTLAAVFVFIAVPYLAQNTVPGDALYAVKVQFNEELRSTLTFDSVEKVEWETERLNRRLAEARLLANEGRLTEVVEAEVAAAVRTHTESAKREIAVLRTKDADEATIASIALDTTLEVQAAALKGNGETVALMALQDEESVAAKTTNNLIAEAIDASRESNVQAEASSTLPAYVKLMARVEQNTTRMYELRDVLAEAVSTEELAGVTRRIEDVERSIQEVILLAETDEQAARQLLVEVLQRSQRVIVYINEAVVAKTVDIDTLVPVVLTSEEEKMQIASTTAMLIEKLNHIASTTETITDEGIIEKVRVGEQAINLLMTQMASSSEQYEAFVSFATEATVIADDLLMLVQNNQTQSAAEDLEPIVPVVTEDTASTTPEVEPVDDSVKAEVDDQGSTTAE